MAQVMGVERSCLRRYCRTGQTAQGPPDSRSAAAAAGARIALDDFGTGWASLTYHRAFPVSGLKIGRDIS